ncbi:hypothetical protein, partial [Chryseobacterium arthrosphaerae]|uniref:hypothetical protein n=1 Tax=Chryseobacterium arthrosphaerae TaxID=651561 RepID=UPI0024154460
DKDYVGTIIVSSVVYLNIGLHDKAKADLASGKIKAARIKNRFSRLMDLNSINRIYADICRIEKDYQCAFRLFNQSVLTLKRIKINLENNVERRTVNRNLAINHIKLAEIYTIMKDFKNAKKILRQGSKYAESSEDPRIMSIILSEIAVVNKFEGNYATAIPILQQMLKEPSLNEDIKSNIHKELAENYKHMKNIERENSGPVANYAFPKNNGSLNQILVTDGAAPSTTNPAQL